MSKFLISSTKIHESIQKLELINNGNIQKDFIEEIRIRVNGILNGKEFLAFESKKDIYEILCYEIDELIKSYPKLPKGFKDKLGIWRVKEYLKIIKNNKINNKFILEKIILSDKFLYSNYNYFKIASFELLGGDYFYGKYFENPNIVKFVLQFFADNTKTKNILDLQPSDLFYGVKTLDGNGWKTYLDNSSRHFFGTDGKKGNGHKVGPALERLKEIAGIYPED